MTDTRRLSAKVRERHRAGELDNMEIHALANFALHDLDVADRELAAAQATIAQQGAVIAAMWQGISAAYTDVHEQGLSRLKGRIVALWTLAQDFAQLAADHDAAVRADERRKVLSLLADDGFAMTFQTTGQYRSALIRALAAQPEEAGEE